MHEVPLLLNIPSVIKMKKSFFVCVCNWLIGEIANSDSLMQETKFLFVNLAYR